MVENADFVGIPRAITMTWSGCNSEVRVKTVELLVFAYILSIFSTHLIPQTLGVQPILPPSHFAHISLHTPEYIPSHAVFTDLIIIVLVLPGTFATLYTWGISDASLPGFVSSFVSRLISLAYSTSE